MGSLVCGPVLELQSEPWDSFHFRPLPSSSVMFLCFIISLSASVSLSMLLCMDPRERIGPTKTVQHTIPISSP